MYVYFEKDIRKTDQRAQQLGFTIQTLMENAGRSLYEAIITSIKPDDRIAIIAGTGNNGGDGIVLARYLKDNGYMVSLIFPLGNPKTEAAMHHLHYYQASGYSVDEWSNEGKYDVIIDAMLGIGARRGLREDVQRIVHWANQSQALRIAVDIPTGLTADFGGVEEAFKAHFTYCLHGIKPSAFLEPSASYYGTIKCVSIGLPQMGQWKVWTDEDVKRSTPIRGVFSHKGTFGTGFLIAGSDEMPGSALLAALGAMRSGIGKLAVGTTKLTASVLVSSLPEATYVTDGLQKTATGNLPSGIRCAAIGPGLVDQDLVEQAVVQLLMKPIPVVLDAGALSKRIYPNRKYPTVLTPHPGEFSRITELSSTEIKNNRIILASHYAQKHGVIVVLKGTYTVTAFPDGTGIINTTGNSGLAKGGTGDTLTGMLLAFLSIYENVKEAVANAVYIHGLCADEWAKNRAKASMLASDLSRLLPYVLKRFEQ